MAPSMVSKPRFRKVLDSILAFVPPFVLVQYAPAVVCALLCSLLWSGSQHASKPQSFVVWPIFTWLGSAGQYELA